MKLEKGDIDKIISTGLNNVFLAGCSSQWMVGPETVGRSRAEEVKRRGESRSGKRLTERVISLRPNLLVSPNFFLSEFQSYSLIRLVVTEAKLKKKI